jgi:hypothetical protein
MELKVEKEAKRMTWGQPLGLDELMIVNPGPAESSRLYQLQELGRANEPQELGQVFLGEDGILYQVQGLDQTEELQGLGEFFLGEDGTLYQVQGVAPYHSVRAPGQPGRCSCQNR